MIRRAEPNDARSIYEILSKTDDPWTMGVIESELKSESSKAFVYVDEEGAVQGFVDIKILYDEADLMHIAVSEELRGQGIGARLLAKAIEESEEKAELTNVVIAKDGIAVIVNNDNAIDDLSLDQIKAIFVGETKTWGDIK